MLPGGCLIAALLNMIVSTGSVAAADDDGIAAFRDFLTGFISTWNERDLSKLDKLVDPDVGLWIIYDLGAVPSPYRFTSVSEPIKQDNGGFGRLGYTGWDCVPQPGPPASCQGAGEKMPLCRFGLAEPTFLDVFEIYLTTPETADTDTAGRARKFVESLAHVKLYFVSDDHWGGTFYFLRSSAIWRLVVVDTTDCGA